MSSSSNFEGSTEPACATPITCSPIEIGIATSDLIPRSRKCGLASST